MLKIYDDSINYTCQVIKLPTKIPVKGLDNLVEVNHQGNSCLVGKDSPEDQLYLFFPAECQISHEFLSKNNLYRHETLNSDPTKRGFFEDNRRVKAIKFKGIISSGFITPLLSLRENFTKRNAIGIITAHEEGYYEIVQLKPGDEFNELYGKEICRKYVRKMNQGASGFSNPKVGMIDNIVDRRYTPEHPDTGHLLRNTHKLEDLSTPVVITYKLHGTSARTYRAPVKKKLNWKARLAKWFGVKIVEKEYEYVACSRRQVKSVGFEELPNKNHWFTTGDLWSEWAKANLDGKLNKGESVYYELVGRTYGGEQIQGGYTYGFDGPECFIYRISNINSEGIEVDLSWNQLEKRAEQLGLKTVPVLFKGTIGEFIEKYDSGQTYITVDEPLTRIFYNKLLEKPSILDSTVVEEGFCVAIQNSYPKTENLKIKSKKFLEYETKALDKEAENMEEEQNAGSNN